MREGKEKNGSGQPGAIHNPCSQAFNTVSKTLAVQTHWSSPFSQLITRSVVARLLVASTTDSVRALALRGGLGPGSSVPRLRSAEKAAVHALPLKPVAASTALQSTHPGEGYRSWPPHH